MKFFLKSLIILSLNIPNLGYTKQNETSMKVNDTTTQIREGTMPARAPVQSRNGNYYDIRSFGVISDKKTDWTPKIRQAIKEIGENSTLYIPSGVNWDYKGIYQYMKNYQTIIDDSGRDKPRGVWQNSRYIWYKTNENTDKTSGNTFGIAGDYHPAFFVDTWSETAGGRKASVIFRDHGIAKWQVALNQGSNIKNFEIAQYGSKVYGTKNLVIGHQDGPAWGKFAFNTSLNPNGEYSYSFGKPQSTRSNETLGILYSRPNKDTGGFTEIFRHGNTTTYRTDISKDGNRIEYFKNGGKVTTKSNGTIYGYLTNIIQAKSNITLKNEESGSLITNVAANNDIIITLPKAIPGLSYEISIDSNHLVKIQPFGTDKLIGLTIGQIIQSHTIESKLRLVAVSTTTWSMEKVGLWRK